MSKQQKLEAFRSIQDMKAKYGVLIYAPTSALEERFLLVPSVYRIIAKEIEEAEDCEGLAWVLCNSLGTAKIASNLKLLAKTHKTKLGYRPIHACIGYAYEPLSRWCAHKMQQTLVGCSYILRDSHDLVQKLAQIQCTKPTFYRLDVQDFFLSGTPSALAGDSTQAIVPTRTRLICQRALYFMLERQLVAYQDGEEKVYLKVTRGSGMGLMHSGACADCALRYHMERNRVDSPDHLRTKGIAAYFRFKDDILIIVEDKSLARPFILELMGRSAYYHLIVESVSSESTKFLDLRIGWTEGKFTTVVEPKATSLSMPLSTESSHPPSVHMSWPKSYINRLFTLSSPDASAVQIMESFIARLSEYHTHPKVIQVLQGEKGRLMRREGAKKRLAKLKPTVWYPMPYHPFMEKIIHAEMKACSDASSAVLWRNAFDDVILKPAEPSISICWKNELPTVDRWLRDTKMTMYSVLSFP
jgi:hypothetical protein